MRISALLSRASLAMLVSASIVAAQDRAPRVVLKGHDPVAYFTEGKPVKGDPRISFDWDEGRYYFASTRNRDMFSADPERYAPQFGGYCTGSMSRGVRGNEANPQSWVIADGRLYVFGAPDDATASAILAQYKEWAERDPALFESKIGSASENWQSRK